MSRDKENLSPLKFIRREKILDVAERLFSQQGFRATTMEQVALEVGMSKVTVYSYFGDKDILFKAVAERLAERLKKIVKSELSSEDLLSQRISSALVEKHRLVFELVKKSAFSTELFSSKDKFAALIFKDADLEIEAMLAEALFQQGRSRAQSASIARLLFGASTGIANHSKSAKEMALDIKKLVNSVID